MNKDIVLSLTKNEARYIIDYLVNLSEHEPDLKKYLEQAFKVMESSKEESEVIKRILLEE